MYHNYNFQEIDLIKKWVIHSFQLLIKRDYELINPEVFECDYLLEGEKILNREVHETTINHRLALYMEMIMPEVFSHYHIDIEYNRYINNPKVVQSIRNQERNEVRPDILVHSRTNLDIEIPHLLVVEAKKYENNQKDIKHIKDIMADRNYKYKYGLLVSYYENRQQINCELMTFDDGTFGIDQFSIER